MLLCNCCIEFQSSKFIENKCSIAVFNAIVIRQLEYCSQLRAIPKIRITENN